MPSDLLSEDHFTDAMHLTDDGYQILLDEIVGHVKYYNHLLPAASPEIEQEAASEEAETSDVTEVEQWRYKDAFHNGEDLIGKQVCVVHKGKHIKAVVCKWLPSTETDPAFYHIQHEDRDGEDLLLDEVLEGMKRFQQVYSRPVYSAAAPPYVPLPHRRATASATAGTATWYRHSSTTQQAPQQAPPPHKSARVREISPVVDSRPVIKSPLEVMDEHIKKAKNGGRKAPSA